MKNIKQQTMKGERQSLLSRPTRPIATIVSLMAMLQVSEATLSVTVTGDALGNGSTWVFNGTSVVTLSSDNELEEFDAEKNVNYYFHSSGDFDGNYTDQSIYSTKYYRGFTMDGGTVEGSTSGGFTFDGLLVDGDGGGAAAGGDDFGWLLGDQSPHTFVAGETLTFTNYTLVTDLDITTFGFDATKIDNNGDTFTVSSESEPMGFLTMTFTAVPEPSSTLLLGLGAMTFVTRRKRNQ
ncbi:MAG: PEP-CTERM sorting domain-containing protein [Akkermansiaceae bacterium]